MSSSRSQGQQPDNKTQPLSSTALMPNMSIANDHHHSSKASTSSRVSQTRIKALELRKLDEERKLRMYFLNKQMQKEKEFLEKKYQMLKDFDTDDDDFSSNYSNSEYVQEWSDAQNDFATEPIEQTPITVQQNDELNISTGKSNVSANADTQAEATNIVADPALVHNTNVNANAVTNSVYNSTLSNLHTLHPNSARVNFAPLPAQGNSTLCNSQATLIRNFSHAQPRVSNILPHTSFNNFGNNTSALNNLSSEQIHARQSVPRELPIFTGKPEEWPIFSATYDWSSTICGLTDAENLIRFQKSLKGEAYNAVQNILIHPSCVPAAISTLTILFGQPEKILYSIKNKIKLMPPINQNKIETFTHIAINVKGLQTTIEAAGLFNELDNSSLLQELIEKLPTSLQLTWGTYKLSLMRENKHSNLATFADWIFEYGISASNICTPKTTTQTEGTKNKKGFINSHYQQQIKVCKVCSKENHNTENCPVFLKADRPTRWSLVRQHNLCRQCLQQHANRKLCEAKVCGVASCTFKHHALLHRFLENEAKSTSADRQKAKEKSITSCNAHCDINSNVLFRILPITIYGKNDKSLQTYAFIDEGSSISLMDQEIADELNVDGTIEPLCLKWTGEMHREENASKVIDITIAGPSKKKTSIHVHTVRKLSLPMQSLDYGSLSESYGHIRNLPVGSYKDAVPRLLIGIDHWKLAIPHKILEGNKNEPVAVKTKLGWQIYGTYDATRKRASIFYNFHICPCAELTNVVRQVYSCDSIGINTMQKLPSNKEDERALNLLQKFTHQVDNKHFESGLLCRYDNFELPESYNMAKQRLCSLDKKIEREPDLLQVFNNTIADYLRKGYVRKATQEELHDKSKRIWYLPIFAVFNKNKPGKARVVWDAAAKVNGVSLNTFLLKGPDLLASLPSVLFRFRQKSIAISADIQEMFHQVFIRQEDQNVQRFLWHGPDNIREPEVYIMNVMIFGAACSPCTSQYVKNINAERFRSKYENAVKAIQNNHYVDDYLDSTDTVTQAIQLANEVRYIHKEGGYNIPIQELC